MKVTYLQSATVIVEANGVRVLMDPWLVDGEYYGSWAQWPPFDWSGDPIGDVDFIYISHIHPDHLSAATLAKLPKTIPVLIHRYEQPFLKRRIEGLGFEVRELPHNTRVDLGKGVTLNVVAADDCDPELCGKFFGCAPLMAKTGSTQIDTLCVVDDGRQVLVNTNDCPYALARELMPKILADYGRVDFLLTGYSGAGAYPQCFGNLSADEKATAAAAKKQASLNQGLAFVRALKPRYVLPFAGQYTLAGKLTALNPLRGVAEVEEAAALFQTEGGGAQAVLLNSRQSFDVGEGAASGGYVATDTAARQAYQDAVLAQRRFSFEDDPEPAEAELEALLRQAFARVEGKRGELAFASETAVYVDLGGGHFGRAPMNGGELSIRGAPAADEPHIVYRTDPRLLKRILSGPAHAHWNNAEIGSHIAFERRPDAYERGLYHVMNFFHA
jgi:UDP-MurNAc hydroxylase